MIMKQTITVQANQTEFRETVQIFPWAEIEIPREEEEEPDRLIIGQQLTKKS